MSAAALQPLLTAGDECKNLLRTFTENGGKCSNRVQALVSSISNLCRAFQMHHDAVGSSTSTYASYESCQSTLGACYDFLKKYVNALEKNSTRSAKSLEEKNILFLEGQIQLQLSLDHKSALTDIHLQFLRRDSVLVTGSSSDPPNEVGPGPATISSAPPPVLEYPIQGIPGPFSHDPHSISPTDGDESSWGPGASTENPGLGYGNPSESRMSSYAPSWNVSNAPSWKDAGEYAYEETSPQPRASVTPSIASNNFQSICRIMIPKVFEKGASISGMPRVKQHEKWWEIIFEAKNGKPILIHSIPARYSRTCIPYTEWGGWKRPFGLEILDPDPPDKKNRQKVSIPNTSRGLLQFAGTPKYIFLDPQKVQDPNESAYLKSIFFEFNSAIYGKTLLDIFDIDIITSARARKWGSESSNQQLKIWIDHEESSRTESYITFFANNETDRRHLQFPISWIDDSFAEDKKVTLHFLTKSRIKSREKRETKVKKSATFGSQNTRPSSVFSTASTSTFESTTTVSTSRSNTYDPVNTRQEIISEKAEQMEYLKISFTKLADSIRFQVLMANLQSSSSTVESASPSFDGFAFPMRSPRPSGGKLFESMASSSASRNSWNSGKEIP